jgi:lipid II:glycine glycyltransferase (peptidoglycan interpeptide bridge formation enzyme)
MITSPALPEHCQLVEDTRKGAPVVGVSTSPQESDPEWDSFLSRTSLGQFQQSSMWARVKLKAGWRPTRIVFTADNGIVGGFQILSKKSRLGRIGYVSKGPVMLTEDAGTAALLVKSLKQAMKGEGLSAAIIQPPDVSELLPEVLRREGFPICYFKSVGAATLMVDLTGSFETVEGRMSKYTRKHVRQATRRGVTIREGTARDTATFFRLMLSTCERQGAAPEPPTEAAVAELWERFHQFACVRLSFAECDGEPVAAQLAIPFGGTVRLWKKGWSSTHGDKHPNELLTHEVIQWAHAKGFKNVDFGALDKRTAQSLLQGLPLDEDQTQSRDKFNLGFGGRPVLLPEARVWFGNGFLRRVYGFLASRPLTRGLMEKFVA